MGGGGGFSSGPSSSSTTTLRRLGRPYSTGLDRSQVSTCGLRFWLGVAEDVRGGSGKLSNKSGRGVGGTTGVLGEVEINSESEGPVLAPAELLRDRRRRRFGGGEGKDPSSPPLVCSPSASLILSPNRRNMIFLAANRSPPAIVLLRPNFPDDGGGVGDDE